MDIKNITRSIIKSFQGHPRTTAAVLITLTISAITKLADKPSEYNIVIASLIALIAAMMAHHSATMVSTDKTRKDKRDEDHLRRTVIIRAKVMAAELESLTQQKHIDFNEKIDIKMHHTNEKNRLNVELPLASLYICRISLPADFNYIKENLGLIPSPVVVNCISRISFITETINSHIDCQKTNVSDFTNYISSADKIASSEKENVKLVAFSSLSNFLTSQPTNRLSSALDSLREISTVLSEEMKNISH
ncbi:hypothetical protein EDF83_1488 [Pseudomonas protegens]|uniref:hypothetical protein n=1 Tax=Pseudomonas TaxID=286 RepID=UPI000FA0D928|nr:MULTISPECIES: hypothetical protein [Pseudomonas]MCS4260220.1 hypothetical protein [Pseudomonas sp. BIGb0176]ROQ62208.1 hypothetical protein EDF83_1488 [Pseudomonas protegens]ROQ84527.1 hypothetical protein EC837_1405 [Pseudomonas protegens]